MTIVNSKTILIGLCLTVLGASGTASLAQTPPASAAKETAAPDTLKVSLSGLDLSTPEGVHAAQERVRLAARRVCAKVANSADMQRQLDYITCIDEAMAPVVARIDAMSRQVSGERLAHNSAK
jgi:UrcA family protein